MENEPAPSCWPKSFGEGIIICTNDEYSPYSSMHMTNYFFTIGRYGDHLRISGAGKYSNVSITLKCDESELADFCGFTMTKGWVAALNTVFALDGVRLNRAMTEWSLGNYGRYERAADS